MKPNSPSAHEPAGRPLLHGVSLMVGGQSLRRLVQAEQRVRAEPGGGRQGVVITVVVRAGCGDGPLTGALAGRVDASLPPEHLLSWVELLVSQTGDQGIKPLKHAEPHRGT